MKSIDNYLLNLRILPRRTPINKKDYQALLHSLTAQERAFCRNGIPYNGTILYSHNGD